MGYLTKSYRLTYVSKNFTSGLTDIVCAIIKPDKTILGTYAMTEFASPFLGVYYYDYTTVSSDPEGEYIYIVVSPSEEIIVNGTKTFIRDVNRFAMYKQVSGVAYPQTASVLVGYVDAEKGS